MSACTVMAAPAFIEDQSAGALAAAAAAPPPPLVEEALAAAAAPLRENRDAVRALLRTLLRRRGVGGGGGASSSSGGSSPRPAPHQAHHHPHHHHQRRRPRRPAAAAPTDDASAAEQAALPATALGAEELLQHDHTQQHEQQHEHHHHHDNNWLRRALRRAVHAVRALAAHARPHGPGLNDTTLAERLANVVTAAPFALIGVYTLRTRASPAARHFGASFIAVGVVAGAYHAATGTAREVLRKCDYYMINLSACLLRRAAHVRLPRAAALAAAALVPVKPSAVTAFNLALIEAKFAATALAHPAALGKGYALHLLTAAAGIASFLWEDVAIARGHPPVFHCAWHCLSAVAIGSSNALLAHGEALLEGALLGEAVAVVVALDD